jgi:hypothetical protein
MLHGDDLHPVPVPDYQTAPFDLIVEEIRTRFGLHAGYNLMYTDERGDTVGFSTDAELSAALRVAIEDRRESLLVEIVLQQQCEGAPANEADAAADALAAMRILQ